MCTVCPFCGWALCSAECGGKKFLNDKLFAEAWGHEASDSVGSGSGSSDGGAFDPTYFGDEIDDQANKVVRHPLLTR